MTREEAIKVLEKQFDKSCGNYRYQNAEKLDFEDALWVAISALRQQETVTERHDLTNAQRIRAMSDEELRNWLFRRDCKNIADFLQHGGAGVMDAVQLLDWLQQPAEEAGHER